MQISELLHMFTFGLFDLTVRIFTLFADFNRFFIKNRRLNA